MAGPKLKKFIKTSAIVGLLVLVGIQFIPVDGIGKNPDEHFAVPAPPEVKAILDRACMDCHSNETRWPWYARLAPASWLLARDVKKGRGRLNFSEWEDMSEEDRAIDKESAWDEIEEGEMPPWFYYPAHPDAILSDADKALLKEWMLAPVPEAPEAEEADEAGGDKAAAGGEGDEAAAVSADAGSPAVEGATDETEAAPAKAEPKAKPKAKAGKKK